MISGIVSGMPLKYLNVSMTPIGPPSCDGAVVRHQKDERIVEFAHVGQELDQPADLHVGVIEERRERLLQAQARRC